MLFVTSSTVPPRSKRVCANGTRVLFFALVDENSCWMVPTKEAIDSCNAGISVQWSIGHQEGHRPFHQRCLSGQL